MSDEAGDSEGRYFLSRTRKPTMRAAPPEVVTPWANATGVVPENCWIYTGLPSLGVEPSFSDRNRLPVSESHKFREL